MSIDELIQSGYVQMMEDVESGKVGICVMKDLTRWGRDHVQVGIAMETFRKNGVRFIAINIYTWSARKSVNL